MRVPLTWLREYVEVDLAPEALAERLTLLGMEVKGIERRGSDWRRVVVGELLDVRDHPASDHLHLTKVRVGDGEPVLSIVCGAQNIATGQHVPVALPGALLPGDRAIEVTTIAGEESQGMLCSGAELGITTDADGILILPGDAPVGMAFHDLFGDVVLDVDVKPNRGDALSLIGLAREVAAATGARVRWPEIAVRESGAPTSASLSVEVRDATLCPRFVGRYIDGVETRPSPLVVQARLTAAGMRPVSNVVDASNYVMLELGKPIHIFDAAGLDGGRIIVRRAEAGERLETLDHVVRVLTPETLIVADPRGPVALAGVMGGAESEVGDATSAIVIESAVFDPVSVRRTAQRFALRSEASLRMEKGQESRLARIGADRTAQLVVEWGGGRIAPGRVDTAPHEPERKRLPFRPARVNRLLGTAIPAAEMRALLARVEVGTEPARGGDVVPIGGANDPIVLDASGAAEALIAVVPTHRRDLEVEADVAEEVARVRGYERVGATLPDTLMPAYRPDPRRLVDTVRDLLAGRGLDEVVTHALVAPHDHARLGIAPDDAGTIVVTNPISLDHSELRRSMLPGLAGVLAENERQRRPDVALFEIGSTHRLVAGLPVETPWLAILLAGERVPGAWNEAGRASDLWDAVGLVDWLVDRLGVPRPVPSVPAPVTGVEHPGRTVAFSVTGPDGDTRTLGRAAELDPRYLEAVGVRAEHVIVALVSLEELALVEPGRRRYRSFPRVPAVDRDLAIVIRDDQRAGDVERVIREAAGRLLRGVRVFDVYRGAPLATGELSLAVRLTLQAPDRTMTDEEIEATISSVIGALGRELGVRIRS